MQNTKPPLAETLMSMPDVGEDSDFARIEDGNDNKLAVRQMQHFMTTTPWVDQVDLKALIEDGRAGNEILDAMTDQMNQTMARAEAAIDEAPAAIDASNRQIENFELKAKRKET